MEKISKTNLLLETLIKEVSSLKEVLIKRETEPIKPPEPIKPAVEEPASPQIPIPKEYRETVDKILNKSFGIRIIPRSDALVFEFVIIVPDRYSNMTSSQREIMKEDIRPRVIPMAEGINGVKEWTEKVYRNFNPEIQALIVADRSG